MTLRKLALLAILPLPLLIFALPVAAQKLILGSDYYINSAGVAQGPITAPDFKPVAGNVYIYADAVNGSDTNPGTQAAPLKTFPAAIAKIPSMWTGQCRVILAAGAYTASDPTMIRGGYPIGPLAAPLVIQGTMIDSGLGTRTISGVTTSGSTVIKIQDNTIVATLNQYDGYFLRMTSGPAIGMRRMVRANTTDGNFELQSGDNGTHPAAGNTFVIEKPGSIVTFGMELSLDAAATVGGVGMVLSQINFTSSTFGGQLFMSTPTYWYSSTFTFSNYVTAFVNHNGVFGAGRSLTSVANVDDVTAGIAAQSGIEITSDYLAISTSVQGGGYLDGLFSLRGGGMYVGYGATATLRNFDCDEQGHHYHCLAIEGATVWHSGQNGQRGTIRGVTYSTLDCVKANAGTLPIFEAIDISNCADAGIGLYYGSRAYLHGNLTGTGNATYGVVLEHGSVAGVSNGGGANSITGASGDIHLAGATDVIGVWANVYTGTAYTSSDAGIVTKNW
jgi:hypothetical protein